MKIREFAIQRYGPMRETGRLRLENFNLFAGENEDGKTLTIEALIKLLFQRKAGKNFPRINRVPENPEGFIVLELSEAGELKIPEEGSLSDLAKISPADFRNLFVIRNSNLSIENEEGFYSDLTERLTGLRIRRINQIRQKLLSLAQLTGNLAIADTQETHKLKSRLNQAAALRDQCAKLLETADQNGYGELETRIVQLQEEIEQRRREQQDQENARLRDKYRQGTELLHTLQDVSGKIQELDNITDEDLRAWVVAEEKLHNLEHDHAKETNRVKKFKTELAEITRLKDELTGKANLLQRKIERVSQKTEDQINEYQRLTANLAASQSWQKGLTIGMGSLLALTIIAFTGLIWRPLPYLPLITAALCFLLLSALSYSMVKIFWPGALVKKIERQVINTAAGEGFNGGSVPEVAAALQQMRDERQKIDERTGQIAIRIDSLQDQIRSQEQQRIPAIEADISTVKTEIQELKEKHGVNSTEEYSRLLTSRKAFERQLAESRAALQSLFKPPRGGDALEFWERQVRELEPYSQIGDEIRFEEQKSENIRRELQTLEEELQNCRRNMREYQESLKEIERKAGQILAPESEAVPIFCQNREDLKNILQKLTDFITEVNQRQEDIRMALSTFETIEAEESAKISALFGKNSTAARYFRKFTGGMYTDISYTREEGVRVTHREGIRLEPGQLSGGTYDQLYLAIRLALGEKLLGSEKGFFILDDPFLKADTQRLQAQLGMLREIARAGWQILYFTAKEEVKQALKEAIASGDVALFPPPFTRLKKP